MDPVNLILLLIVIGMWGLTSYWFYTVPSKYKLLNQILKERMGK